LKSQHPPGGKKKRGKSPVAITGKPKRTPTQVKGAKFKD